ncbi:hypothetical protein PV327_008908 [Microctonus hyperodae]|uniref:Glucuronosyltransferase n=1 Tax=Microctonus hyperodae TaxID=165561 RepID=A0AA39FTQ7_MICHY|nr:hypothetical protein PV327_008908 [Microctonus hyperodae]
MLTIESFPRKTLENIYKSFRKIAPVRIFMKVPRPEQLPPGLPENVRTFIWIPQLKVLKHKNIRAFITHGGLMGTQEAISCAVPMIGIPLFADQFINIDLCVSKKIAVRLDHDDLTEIKLDAALNEVLHNPIYRKAMKEVSNKFLDRPLSPMDEACYWVEYTIRYGNKALRSPALDLSCEAAKNISKKFWDRPLKPLDEACYWVEYIIKYGSKALRSPAVDFSCFRSHMTVFEQLMKGLARRGHQVDVISSFPQKKPYPNYTDIVVPSLMPNYINNMSYQEFHDILQDNVLHSCVSIFGNNICEAGFTQPQVRRLIKNPPMDPPYDVVITEILTAHCFMGFGYHLNVPVIGVSASILPPWIIDILATPSNLAFVSLIGHGYNKNMDFWNRVKNVFAAAYSKMYFNYYTKVQTDLIKQYFGTDAPDVRELEQDLALVLVNSHSSITGVKPITPAHVEVGGLHIQDDDSEIPADDKKWLDESTNGFIFFTLGSMVNIETFPEKIIGNIYKSFRKIAPVRVFMKVPQPELLPPGLPKNVRTFKWISQLKVLKHKNIRAFITHGGLLSTLEAISCGVPMIGVPLFYDQAKNIDRCVDMNIAVFLDYHALTESNLDTALNDVLHNPIYR